MNVFLSPARGRAFAVEGSASLVSFFVVRLSGRIRAAG